MPIFLVFWYEDEWLQPDIFQSVATGAEGNILDGNIWQEDVTVAQLQSSSFEELLRQ